MTIVCVVSNLLVVMPVSSNRRVRQRTHPLALVSASFLLLFSLCFPRLFFLVFRCLCLSRCIVSLSLFVFLPFFLLYYFDRTLVFSRFFSVCASVRVMYVCVRFFRHPRPIGLGVCVVPLSLCIVLTCVSGRTAAGMLSWNSAAASTCRRLWRPARLPSTTRRCVDSLLCWLGLM